MQNKMTNESGQADALDTFISEGWRHLWLCDPAISISRQDYIDAVVSGLSALERDSIQELLSSLGFQIPSTSETRECVQKTPRVV